ncbi:unnamed protein product [Hapterophycus canaliculatus]
MDECRCLVDEGGNNASSTPRPPRFSSTCAGKVFVEYDTKESAQKAALSLAGRQFGANIVKVEYMNEDKFGRRDFD